MNGDATFDGPYRYRLSRWWAEGPRVTFVMLNPNAADATRDDPTIRRCIGFAQRWGYAGLEVLNLFAWCCRDPRELRGLPDAVGPKNDGHLRAVAGDVVIAWGNHGLLGGRDREVLAFLASPMCLGVTKRGCPVHPLYVPADRPRRGVDSSDEAVTARGQTHALGR